MTKLTVEVDTKKTTAKWEYPFLGIAESGLIVLFNKPGEGMVLANGNGYTVGEIRKDWSMSYVNPFVGSITLTQN